MNIDLNIDNYELDDILNLFKIDYDFNHDDLKRVKKYVLQTHPDKSKLSKEYFLFFTKAYKIIYAIYNTREKREKSTTYILNEDDDNKELLKKVSKKEDFNKIFNELFDKLNVKEDNGYGDWLTSDEDMDYSETSKQDLHTTIENKKSKARALIVKHDIKELGGDGDSNCYNELIDDNIECYQTGIFSSLQYEDLYKAHTETVIPVTQEDYKARKHFNNDNDLKLYREKQDNRPKTQEESKEILNNKYKSQEKEDIKRIYKLVKQDEIIEKKNQDFINNFKLLTR
tara:strand:+ start:7223 stop:8077 length:855 start_codon:yes stop_codon:yes gene_type:complete